MVATLERPRVHARPKPPTVHARMFAPGGGLITAVELPEGGFGIVDTNGVEVDRCLTPQEALYLMCRVAARRR